MDTNNEIWFYDTKNKPYGVFSNFYSCKKFTYNNKEYFHSEGYFQAEKFQGFFSNSVDRKYSKLIAYQNTAGKSAVLARQKPSNMNYKWAQDLKIIIDKSIENGVCMRPDWENIKDNVMRRAVFIKFNSNEPFKNILIDTGDKLLFEHTHRDHYWADGHPKNNSNIHGDGKNMLGKILEETRYLLGGQIANLPMNEINSLSDFSNWIIPGMLLVSGSFGKTQFQKFKDQGFKSFISLMEKDEEIDRLKTPYHEIIRDHDFNIKSKGINLCRYSIKDRSITSDEKVLTISYKILHNISTGLPTILHCYGGKGRTGTVISCVIGLLYGLNGEDSLKLVGDLFKHRKNKGSKCPKMPQTKVQFDQVKRILKDVKYYVHFEK